MNFYDYYDPKEVLDNPCYLAAQSLIENGFQVIPIKTGTKEPSGNVKSVSDLRQRPVNNFNVDYFFKERDVEIALMLRRNMEVIDVDSKNKKGLSEDFLNSLSKGNPDLYERLVISKTPSGGLHILYTSDTIGGEAKLARIPHKEDAALTIIERLSESNKNYIKCAPSSGYEFIQGNPIELPHLTTDERNWLSAFSASFNTLAMPEVKKPEAARADSPYFVFNSKNTWEYIYNELKDRGYLFGREFDDRVVVKRPGGTQHSGVIWKDNNTLYMYSSSTEFEMEKPYSPFGVYCLYYHDNNVGLACKHLAKDGIGKNIYEEGQFWKRQGKKIIVKYTELAHWLYHMGYRIYQTEIVKITNNIVSVIEERTLKAAFINEIEPEVVDHFYEKVATIFSDAGGLLATIKTLEDKFIKDTDEVTWIFFRNYAVKITATDILPLQYKEIDGYIWENSIIDRSFYNDDYVNSDAERFVKILGGAKYDDLCKLIGYTVSRYKDPINPKAVVLIEDIDAEDEGESQGGSGKGLLFNFIRQFRKIADFDGKNFRINDTFLYQNIEPDTNIIFIDDVERKFKFSSLFSVLTTSLIVNKKNKPQIIIPYETSPKIFITSNFSVGDMDISTTRRKYEFAIVKYFGKDKEPIDEFKRQFFSGWDLSEWSKFDNFICYCCQKYLSETNKKSIGNVTANSSERSLLSNTNKDFIEYMDSQLSVNFFDFAPNILKSYNGLVNGVHTSNGVNMSDFIPNQHNPDYYFTITKDDFTTKMINILHLKTLTTTKITQWLRRWADSRNVKIDTSYKRGATGERCYRIIEFNNINTKNNSDNEPFTLF